MVYYVLHIIFAYIFHTSKVANTAKATPVDFYSAIEFFKFGEMVLKFITLHQQHNI